MSGKILVLTAIDNELDKARAPDGVRVIYTGVGKINAASATTLALLAQRPALVINYGTAGKINETLQGLVEVSGVIQRDMMAMPLAARGRTPFAPELDRLTSGQTGVICGTGDSFVTTSDPWLVENQIDIVDMELFAVAQVCVSHSLPWRAFKFITDDANDLAHQDWTANVKDGEGLFWDALERIRS
jgi:adenosylhomocysteine nucleosidase